MNTLRRSIAVLAAGVVLASVAAQETGFSNRFDAPGINGRVWGLGVWNGQVVAGGPFAFLTGGGRLEHVARFDGRDWQDIGGGVDGPVRGIASYNGELVVAGQFASAGGVAVESIARWNGSRWAPLGAGIGPFFTSEVFALTVFQGELYAGGQFSTAGGQPIDTIARWDGTQWRPVGGGLGGGSARKVLSFASDGTTLYVGGEFTSAGGQPASNVAGWDGTSWSSLGAGLADGVHALALFQGDVYAGGVFQSSGGTTCRRVARFDGSSWGPLGQGIPDSTISVQVSSLGVYGGKLWVGGSFGEVDSATRGSGLHASGLATWDGSAWGSVGGLYRNSFGGQTYGIAQVVHDGRLVIAGDFDHAGPLLDHDTNVVSNDCVAWNGTGFEPVGEGVGLGDGASKLVEWNGSLWAIGGNLYAGTAVSPMLARFDGARWHPVGPLDPRSDIDDAVVHQGDLWIVGDLWFRSGQRMAGVIRYDGVNWTSIGGPTEGTLAVYQGELYCGGLGGVQRFTGGSWVRLPSMFGFVNVMETFGGRLYIGGSSLRVGSGAVENLFAWDGTNLSGVAGGADGAVNVLHVHQNELWVGGAFSQIGGAPSPRLARFDGTTFWSFGGSITGPWVRALASLGGDLYIAGELGTIGGTRTRFARWDGNALMALGEGTNSNPTHLLADESTGTVWLVGGFTTANDVVAHGLVTWHARPRWMDLGEALPGSRGAPWLEAFGGLVGPDTVRFSMRGFDANAPLLMVFGASAIDLPIFGGTLVPSVDVVGAFATDPFGRFDVDVPVPAGLGPSFALWVQAWSLDLAAARVIASNAIVGMR